MIHHSCVVQRMLWPEVAFKRKTGVVTPTSVQPVTMQLLGLHALAEHKGVELLELYPNETRLEFQGPAT